MILSVRLDGNRLVVRGRLARTGVQSYQDHTEFRPPEEVFSADAMKSYEGIPAVIGHPAFMTPQNVKGYAVGYVRNVARDDSELAKTGVSYVIGDLVIVKASVIDSIRAGRYAEISLGYNVTLDATPGVTKDGEKYDAIQRGIVANHAGLGPRDWARCGNACSIAR